MTLSSGFQKQVNTQPAVAVEGDFCSGNPRWTYDAGQGGLIAGAAGVIVGRFAWAVSSAVDSNGAPAVVNNFGSGPVTGFVRRGQAGLIVNYLDEASMKVQPGFEMELFSGGDFWVKNNGATQALPGQKCYANLADGKATFAATASPTGAVSTSWSISAQTSTITATVNGNVLNVTAVTGTYGVAIGALLTGGTGAASCYVLSQLSGTANGIGTYAISVPEQPSTATYTGLSFGLLTLTTVSSGVFGVGSTLTGATAGVTAGTTLTQLLTGTGASGSTAIVNLTQTSSSGAEGNLTGALNVETKWICMSSGLAGELVKISSHPLG